MFTKLIEEAEETLEDIALLLSLAQAEEEAEGAESEIPETIQAFGQKILVGLKETPARPETRPGEALFFVLQLTPGLALYPRSRWELETALSRCAAHPQGGLLVIACSPVVSREQLCGLVSARLRKRLGDDAGLAAHLSETERHGLALALIVGHVSGHRAPDRVDAEPMPGSPDRFMNDEDVVRFVYAGSPKSLSAEDTLARYGLTTYDRARRCRAPTLGAQIAFAERPGLKGLAFEVTTGKATRPVRDLPLRRLCDEIIERVRAEDPRVDAATLRQMLLFAVVQRSWRADVRDEPMEVDVGASICVRFPGTAPGGWVRNELLLQLVRRNGALGWDGTVVGFDQRSSSGTGGRTELVLKRRSPARIESPPKTATPPRPTARPVSTPQAARATPPAAEKTPTPRAVTPAPAHAAPARGDRRAPSTPRALPVITSYGPEMKAFLDDVMVLDGDALIDNPVLSDAFAAWCRRHGANEVPSQRWLALRLKAYGFQQAPGRTAGVRRWRGLRLRMNGTDMRDT